MSDENTVGREPIQIVEIDQPACSLNYGVTCNAVLNDTGPRKCFHTRSSCQDPASYTPAFTYVWRFAKPAAVLPRDLYSFSAGTHEKTNPIPSLVSVTTNPTKINIGGGNKDASPLGQRATVTITLQDHLWDDVIGDPYYTERPQEQWNGPIDKLPGEQYEPIERGTFWSKWLARNPYHTKLAVRVYDGYVGQALGSMQVRHYILDRINGPSNDRVTIVAKDPLRLADDKRTLFPVVSDIQLVGGITNVQTAGIEVSCLEAELTAAYGNTGTDRYLRINNEILKYTGYVNSGTNEWTLSGVVRGSLGTTAAAHAAAYKCQRVGRYESENCWDIVEDLLINHSTIDASLIDSSAWAAEGNAYLSPYSLDGTVAAPTPVVDLVGELTSQCSFYIWWDEREQEILMKAIRPPLDDGVASINDDAHIIRDSAIIREDPDQRVSRIYVYYDQQDPTVADNEIGNYSSVRVLIDGDAESTDQYGDVRIRQVFSRWLDTSPQANQTTTRLLARFRNAVRTLSIKLDAKDRSITNADVLEITTRALVDETGNSVPERWQVIAFEEIVPGEIVRYDTQRFEFLGRFWIWASESAPDYSAATDAEKEANAFWSDDDGSPGSGDYGYQWL